MVTEGVVFGLRVGGGGMRGGWELREGQLTGPHTNFDLYSKREPLGGF